MVLTIDGSSELVAHVAVQSVFMYHHILYIVVLHHFKGLTFPSITDQSQTM